VLNDIVYIIGGSDAAINGTRINTVLSSRPRLNGDLEPWVESAPFPGKGVSTPAAVSTPGFIHLLGGSRGGGEGGGISDLVWSVPVQPNGQLGDWEAGPRLPFPLWFHNAQVIAGRVVLWGGLTEVSNQSTSTRIFVSPILGSGRLSDWHEVWPEMPTGIYSATNASMGPYLFSLFPRYSGGDVSSDILWTYATPLGLQDWKTVNTNSEIKIYHPGAIDYRRGAIYIIGGRERRGGNFATKSYILRLSQEARQQAEQSWSGAGQNVASNSYSSPSRVPNTPQTAAYAPNQGQQLAYQATQTSVDTDLPGFKTYSEWQQLAQSGTGRPKILYFSSPRVKQCQEQLDNLKRDNLFALTSQADCAMVNVEELPQVAQQRGVFRVPFWLVFNAQQQEILRHGGIIDVQTLLNAAQNR
jgi:hypothetical protein